MKFWQRARYYMIGLGIGTVLTFILFQGRGCSWLPENRVLDDVANSTIFTSEKLQCELECNGITETDIYDLFAGGEGSVLFSESEPRKTPKMYVIEAPDESYKLKITIDDSKSNRDTTIIDTEIIGLVKSGKASCECDSLPTDVYAVYSKPEERITEGLFFVEGREIKFNAKAKCAMECYGIDASDVSSFIANEPKLNKTASDYNAKPHAIYVYENTIDGQKFQFTFEDAGRRTRLIQVLSAEKSCMCD